MLGDPSRWGPLDVLQTALQGEEIPKCPHELHAVELKLAGRIRAARNIGLARGLAVVRVALAVAIVAGLTAIVFVNARIAVSWVGVRVRVRVRVRVVLGLSFLSGFL